MSASTANLRTYSRLFCQVCSRRRTPDLSRRTTDPRHRPSKSTPATAPVEPNDIEKRAFEQTNLVRVKNGLRALNLGRRRLPHGPYPLRKHVAPGILLTRHTRRTAPARARPRRRHFAVIPCSVRTSRTIRATTIRSIRGRALDGNRTSTALTSCLRNFARWRSAVLSALTARFI